MINMRALTLIIPKVLRSSPTRLEFVRDISAIPRLLAPNTSGQASTSSTSVPDVPGLSTDVVKVATGKVGPGASKDSEYKHPEYFCFDENSYYQAEIEMAKYRLPQPSSLN